MWDYGTRKEQVTTPVETDALLREIKAAFKEDLTYRHKVRGKLV